MQCKCRSYAPNLKYSRTATESGEAEGDSNSIAAIPKSGAAIHLPSVECPNFIPVFEFGPRCTRPTILLQLDSTDNIY